MNDNHVSPDVVTFVLARFDLQLNDAATIRRAVMNYLPREGSYETHIVSKVWSTTTQLDEGFNHISTTFVARVLEAVKMSRYFSPRLQLLPFLRLYEGSGVAVLPKRTE